jgi:hypothetical protein
MLGYEIYKVMGNTRVPVETLEDYEHLNEFIGGMLLLFKQNKPSVDAATNNTISKPAVSASNSAAKMRVVDYATKSAKKLNGAFTVRELVEQMLHIEWPTGSTKMGTMVANVKAVIRNHSCFKEQADGTFLYNSQEDEVLSESK